VVPVRLHSGNFDFLAAKPDGSDLRVVAADDKTPLKFWVERFDGTNELAVVWVQLPNVAPGTDKNLVHVYAGNEKAVAETASPALFDGAMAAAFTCPPTDARHRSFPLRAFTCGGSAASRSLTWTASLARSRSASEARTCGHTSARSVPGS